MALIDLRSDTVTRPTDEMRRAMAAAEVGDDVYGEDPTVNRLEEIAAEWLGKEAALFVPSGTMGNQLAVLTHCRPGDEVFVEAEAHVYWYEAGSIARLAGAQPRPIPAPSGRLTPELFADALRPPNIHYPVPRLLCIENTHNRAGGSVLSVPDTAAIAEAAHRAGLQVHLDGARLANAAVAVGVRVQELAAPADSVMACLSKGLCAPVGSVLGGSRAFIEAARRNRKALGGGMRQAGILAAAGILAIERMVDRLAEDHALARAIAAELSAIPGVQCDPEGVATNMVMIDLDRPADPVTELLRREGVLCNPVAPRRLRAVTHRDVSGFAASEIARRFRAALSAS